jgi:hypothetical protein
LVQAITASFASSIIPVPALPSRAFWDNDHRGRRRRTAADDLEALVVKHAVSSEGLVADALRPAAAAGAVVMENETAVLLVPLAVRWVDKGAVPCVVAVFLTLDGQASLVATAVERLLVAVKFPGRDGTRAEKEKGGGAGEELHNG